MKNCPNCKNEVPDEFEICWNCNYSFILKETVGYISDNIKSESDGIKPKKIRLFKM
jgi:RNA polymerase subunit RPABC4/transcription elongation factor Spt4